VKAGDLLFLYTDGLCDLGEGKDLTLGRSPVSHPGAELRPPARRGFLDAVLAQARQFSGLDHFLDDVCLVGIEVERLMGHGP
jgi:serine phosphatase RsbU (regulator of sigma subunit)